MSGFGSSGVANRARAASAPAAWQTELVRPHPRAHLMIPVLTSPTPTCRTLHTDARPVWRGPFQVSWCAAAPRRQRARHLQGAAARLAHQTGVRGAVRQRVCGAQGAEGVGRGGESRRRKRRGGGGGGLKVTRSVHARGWRCGFAAGCSTWACLRPELVGQAKVQEARTRKVRNRGAQAGASGMGRWEARQVQRRCTVVCYRMWQRHDTGM